MTADTDENALYAELDRLGIAHRTAEHQATFTVAESETIKQGLPGGHSKTLLLDDKEGLYLVAALGSARADLNAIGRAVGAKRRLSFAKPLVMEEVLGVRPGTVTPFALMADRRRRIEKVVLDTKLLAFDPVWFHPLRNTASTAISPDGLRRFCAAHAKAVIETDVSGETAS